MASRASPSGHLAVQVSQKQALKFNDEMASRALRWVKGVTNEDINTSGDAENFHSLLKDGVLLCKLVNALQPGIVKSIQKPVSAFACMANIGSFTTACKELGVSTEELFQSVDLTEKRDLFSVVTCLGALKRKLKSDVMAEEDPKQDQKHQNCSKGRQRGAGLGDQEKKFLSTYISNTEFDVNCVGCCYDYLVRCRKYAAKEGADGDKVVFGAGNVTCRVNAPKDGGEGQVFTEQDPRLGQPSARVTSNSRTYQIYGTPTIGAPLQTRLESSTIDAVQSQELQGANLNYANAALLELYRERKGLNPLSGQCHVK